MKSSFKAVCGHVCWSVVSSLLSEAGRGLKSVCVHRAGSVCVCVCVTLTEPFVRRSRTERSLRDLWSCRDEMSTERVERWSWGWWGSCSGTPCVSEEPDPGAHGPSRPPETHLALPGCAAGDTAGSEELQFCGRPRGSSPHFVDTWPSSV